MTIAQLFKPTRQVIAHPIAKPVKDAPARHRVTRNTLPEHRASFLVEGVLPRTRRGQR